MRKNSTVIITPALQTNTTGRAEHITYGYAAPHFDIMNSSWMKNQTSRYHQPLQQLELCVHLRRNKSAVKYIKQF